jgi:hypothetical protein
MPPEGALGFHAADFLPSPFQSNQLRGFVYMANED